VAKSPYTDLRFPLSGISEHEAYTAQWDGTCVDARNMRGYDPRTGRARGGQRAGHSRYLSSAITGNAVQHITHYSGSAAYSGTGASTRTTTAIAVAGGTIKTFTSSSATTSTNGSGALSSTFPWIDSAILFGIVYFVDGVNAKKLTVSTNTVSAWTASAGTFPSNGADLPRLICTWRSRVVQSGISSDAHNWFMSKVGDATNFDYAPSLTTTADAVAGNNALAGQCQDIITALIPYRDDLLWFGGDHSIWQMTGDPSEGGRLDLISDSTGIAFGQAWCKDPAGVVYFFGSRGGLYGMVPQAAPQLLSGKRIQNRMAKIDLSTTKVHLAWDDRQQAVMIYCTPVDGSAATHYVYDTRAQAFWLDSFSTDSENPLCSHVFDGDTPGDRCLLLGSVGGYVNKIDVDALSDVTTAIDSYVWLGPFQGNSGLLKLRETRIALGENSNPVYVNIHRGGSPEAAFGSTAFNSFRHDPDIEVARTMGATGAAIYLKVGNKTVGESWSYESGQVRFEQTGAVAGKRA
jgi:hypothetical protein